MYAGARSDDEHWVLGGEWNRFTFGNSTALGRAVGGFMKSAGKFIGFLADIDVVGFTVLDCLFFDRRAPLVLWASFIFFQRCSLKRGSCLRLFSAGLPDAY